MRMVAHGEVWFAPAEAEKVKHLMLVWNSAKRSAYQSIHTRGLKDNAIKVDVKTRYGKELGQRYVADACLEAKKVRFEHSIFGGSKAFEDLQAGLITKEEWLELRNGSLYSRGDATKKGNPNIRIDGDKITVNDPSARGAWITGKVFIPPRWTIDKRLYDVRLYIKDGKLFVNVSYDAVAPAIKPTIEGTIGVDTNPDGFAVVEVDKSGNLKSQAYISGQRLKFARKEKRDADIRNMAKEVVEKAVTRAKPLVLEDLSFKRDGKGGRKFQRMKANFVHSRMLEAVEARAVKAGIEVIKVNPAFTSVLGIVKYQKMYSLSRHSAAGLVIARRGMGIVERDALTVENSAKDSLTLEGRGGNTMLKRKQFTWFKSFLRPKNIRPHRTLAQTVYGKRGNVGATPTGEPELWVTGKAPQVEKLKGVRKDTVESWTGKIVQVS